MRSVKLIFILLLCSLPLRAQDNQACHATATNCTITSTATNGTIIVAWQPSGNTTTVPTDGQGNTYHPLDTAINGGTSCFITTNSFGVTLLMCIAYANTNGHSGSDTITASASTARISAHFMSSTQTVNSGNPLDVGCAVSRVLASLATSVNACSLTPTQTNDIYFYYGEADTNNQCGTFSTLQPGANGPSVQELFVHDGCEMTEINFNNTTGAIINSGAPTTFTRSYSVTNTSGIAGNFNAFLVTLKSGQTAASAQSYVTIIKYTPQRDSIPKFKPELIFTVLRRWQRPCEPIRFL